MKNLTTDQKYILNKLASEVKAAARVIEVCSDEDIKYALHSLASDLKYLKEEMATLENFAVKLAFQAVHNNQKQEA